MADDEQLQGNEELLAEVEAESAAVDPPAVGEPEIASEPEREIEPESAPEPEPAPEPEVAPAPEPEPEPESAPEPLTAVGLGLLPEVFVSSVSTALHFYAPPVIEPAPARIVEDDADDEAPLTGSSSRRRNRRRGGGGAATEPRPEVEQGGGRQRAVEYITEPQRIKGRRVWRRRSSAVGTVVSKGVAVPS